MGQTDEFAASSLITRQAVSIVSIREIRTHLTLQGENYDQVPLCNL